MSRKRRNKGKSQAKRADVFELYEEAVQDPESDVAIIQRIFKQQYGRSPRTLREDFCGTAALCCAWVEQHAENRAYGVDLDPTPLRSARTRNVAKLEPDQAERVTLLEGDVRSVEHERVDATVAFNFSYFIFKTPQGLRDYFGSVRRSLAPGGIFVLDIFGGWEAQMDVKDRTRYKGFTYVWDQKGIDPVTNNGLFHIHFKFRGEEMKRAFVYNWRLWSIPEVREALESVGFHSVEVFWEGVDEDGEGNGIFRRVKKAENCPGWNAFIVGS